MAKMFFTFIEVVLWALGAHIPKINIAPKLKIVKTWSYSVQCNWNGHVALPRLFDWYWSFKLSWRNSVTLIFGKKFGEDVKGVATPWKCLRVFCAHWTSKILGSISMIQKHLKWFLDGLSPGFVQYWNLWPPRKLAKFFIFVIAAFSALMNGEICLTFIEVLCGLRDSHPPKLPKIGNGLGVMLFGSV